MTNETLPIIKGRVLIEKWEQGSRVSAQWFENALTSEAKNTIVRAIGGDPNHIDQIVIKNGGVVIASSVSVTPVYGIGTVTLNSIFDEGSFNGTLDELNLNVTYSSTTFSILQGLNITKTSTQKISISWRLTQP